MDSFAASETLIFGSSSLKNGTFISLSSALITLPCRLLLGIIVIVSISILFLTRDISILQPLPGIHEHFHPRGYLVFAIREGVIGILPRENRAFRVGHHGQVATVA